MDLLLFESLTLFPLVESLLGNLFTSSREYSVLSDTSLQVFELLLNFFALSLLLVELGLELCNHLVVSLLSLLKVDSDLMDVSKSVEVLVLVHLHIRLFVILFEIRVKHYDLLL
jgi:hypothetical protein